MTRLRGLLIEAGKVAVVAWAVLSLDDWLEAALPTVPDVVRYLLSALLCAVVLEFIIMIAVGPARLKIEWTEKGDPKPQGDLLVRVSSRNPNSSVFTVKVHVMPTSLVARLQLAVMRLEPTLRIMLADAPLRPTVESSSTDSSIPAFSANDATCGFDVRLRRPPVRGGEWRWAQIRWEATHIPEDGTFNVDYRFAHRHWYSRFAIWLLVRKASETKHVRMLRR